MTDLGPLGFAAVFTAVMLVVAWFVACDWHPGLGDQATWQLSGVMIWVPLLTALILWGIAWSLADLWSEPLERRLSPIGDKLKDYIALRLYEPRHAR